MGIGSSSPDSKENKQNSISSSPTISPPNSSSGYFTSNDKEESPNAIPIRKRNQSDSGPILIMSPLQDRVAFSKSPPIITSLSPKTLQESEPEVPTVFNWNHGGQEVYLIGTFTDWKEKISMRQSHNDFTCIQNLPPGTYHFRYIVDGKWQTDPSQPMLTNENGEVNNVIEITAQKKEDLIFGKKFVPPSPPGSYGQDSFEDNKNTPPALPPHLLRALLNTAPSSSDPTLLPLPHHVMLNHLYSLPRKDDKMILVGITSRYKKKFVTTVVYKPYVQPNQSLDMTPELARLRLSDSNDDLVELQV